VISVVRGFFQSYGPACKATSRFFTCCLMKLPQISRGDLASLYGRVGRAFAFIPVDQTFRFHLRCCCEPHALKALLWITCGKVPYFEPILPPNILSEFIFPFSRLRRCSMKRTPLIFAACFMGGFPLIGSQAKQPCYTAASSSAGSHWSYRIIDGRKCWYAGRPMLSRSQLEWPTQSAAKTPPIDQLETASVRSMPDIDGFEARWRDRFLDAMGSIRAKAP
jgi:hypothetical protein